MAEPSKFGAILNSVYFRFLSVSFFCFLLSTLKEHISLHLYKHWFELEILLWVAL